MCVCINTLHFRSFLTSVQPSGFAGLDFPSAPLSPSQSASSAPFSSSGRRARKTPSVHLRSGKKKACADEFYGAFSARRCFKRRTVINTDVLLVRLIEILPFTLSYSLWTRISKRSLWSPRLSVLLSFCLTTRVKQCSGRMPYASISLVLFTPGSSGNWAFNLSTTTVWAGSKPSGTEATSA